ncbi:MAG: cadherin-like domain-containing protein, partial [Candidatus Accumulibacter sp.]|nr:cadherin-like domain-containing protein [Accumulibacter sp.]
LVDLPAHGVLTQAAGGAFLYTPAANYSGADIFTYRASDGLLDSRLATVSLSIASVNDAPHGSSTSIVTLEDTPAVLEAADFGFSDPGDTPANALKAVIIDSLPAAGTLTLANVALSAGAVVQVADIDAKALVFTPAANASGAGYAQLSFRVQDDGGTANGGVDTDPTAKTLSFDVTAVNTRRWRLRTAPRSTPEIRC